MDIMLDSNNNKLVWEQGDLKLVDDLELIKQHILTALYTLKSDWLLDYTVGIDLPRGMREESFLKNDIQKQILGVDGVLSIKTFNMTKEGVNYKIFAHVLTEMGDIELEEVMQQ